MHRRLHYNIFSINTTYFDRIHPLALQYPPYSPLNPFFPTSPTSTFVSSFQWCSYWHKINLSFNISLYCAILLNFALIPKKSISGPAVTNVSILFRLTQYRVFELVSRSVFFSEQSLQRWKHQTSIPLSQITMLWEMSKYFVFSNPWTEIFLSPYYP